MKYYYTKFYRNICVFIITVLCLCFTGCSNNTVQSDDNIDSDVTTPVITEEQSNITDEPQNTTEPLTNTANDMEYSITYELGDTINCFILTPSKAKAGDNIQIKAGKLFDAAIHVYIDGQEIEMKKIDKDAVGYSFVMPQKDVVVTAKFYDKNEMFGLYTERQLALKDIYPEYFGLSTEKGLKVYVWQMAYNDYSCGLISGNDNPDNYFELMDLKGTTLNDMRDILSTYDIERRNITVILWQNPVSSYIGKYMIRDINEDEKSYLKRKQEYAYRLKEILLSDSDPVTITETQALEAIKNYCYIHNQDLREIENSEDRTLYWTIKTEENNIIVCFRSYTGALINYIINPTSGYTYVQEFVPGITEEWTDTDEIFYIRDYIIGQ